MLLLENQSGNRIRFLLIIAAMVFFLTPSSLSAQNRGFGAGIMLGDPTGLNFKAWSTSRTAFVAGLAWSTEVDDHLFINLDYIVHRRRALRLDTIRLTPYLGLGISARLGKGDSFGARIPLGLVYMIPDSRLDLFLELVPVMQLSPETDFDLQGAIGLRFFF